MSIARHPSLFSQRFSLLQFLTIDLVTDFRELVQIVQDLDHVILIRNPDVDEFLAEVAKIVLGVNHNLSGLAKFA